MQILGYAAAAGSIDIMNFFLKELEVDINTRDRSGKAAIHYAAEAGQVAMVSGDGLKTLQCNILSFLKR